MQIVTNNNKCIQTYVYIYIHTKYIRSTYTLHRPGPEARTLGPALGLPAWWEVTGRESGPRVLPAWAHVRYVYFVM
jgi:hypothetical protein